MNTTCKVPSLPGEVFRSEIDIWGGRWLVCIAPSPVDADPSPALRAWVWVPQADPLLKLDRWRERSHRECSPVFTAWALHERACFEAMRDHRDAIRMLNTYRDTPSHMCGAAYSEAKAKLGDAYERLRALGVEP